MLTGWQETSKGGNTFTITNGNSPFQDNVTFNVTGYTHILPMNDGKVSKDARPNPVLKTTIGNLFVSMLIREKVTFDKTFVKPNGTFNNKVRDIIKDNPGKNNDAILKAIVDAVKDKELVCTRVPYVARTQDGRPYPAAIVNIDIK